MDSRTVARKLTRPGAAIVLSVILLATSFMLTSAVQQEGLFGRYYSALAGIQYRRY
jgi:hypothetical protein